MAFSKVPTAMFPGYEFVVASGTVTADSIVIPLTALPLLTSSEANDTTGDSREIARAIAEAIYSYISGLATADKPTKMTVSRTDTRPTAGVLRPSYTTTFDVAYVLDDLELVAES